MAWRRGCGGVLEGDAVGARPLPGARQPVAEAAHRVRGQAREEIEQVRLDVDSGLPPVFYQREEVRQARARVGMSHEQPILGIMESFA